MAQGVEINKRRLRLSRPKRGTPFVLFLAVRQGGQQHCFGPLSLVPFFSAKERDGKPSSGFSHISPAVHRFSPIFTDFSIFTSPNNTAILNPAKQNTVTNNRKARHYPFGLTQKGYNNLTTSLGSAGAKKYQYNGKELQDDYGLDWYDYGARFYDAGLGRFFTVDPLADQRSWVTPYNFVQNNPINRIDPTGALDNWDWYESEAGNVIWQEGDAKNITVNGEDFTNIGKTYSAPMEGGGYLNYFQDMPIAITSSKANVGQLLAKNDELFRNAMSMASTREMQSEIFMTRFNINRSDASTKVLLGTLAVPAAVIGGQFLLSGGIISTSFWGGKAAISAGTQAIMNKGDVDVFDVAANAFLTPGASALIGGAVDYNPFRRNNTFNYVGGNKTIGQFGLDVGTGYLSGTLGSKASNVLGPYLQNGTERAIFNTVISTPSSVFGIGVNQAIKKRFNE